MNSLMLQIRRAADVTVVDSRPARRAVAVLAFALLTAFSAHVSVPLIGTPVPVSMQTLVVVLSGLLLGPALGVAAQTAYLMAGAAGLPVFAQGLGLPYLFGPTGGFLLAFPVAAAVAGLAAARLDNATSFRLPAMAVAAAAGAATILLGGWAQLAAMTGDAATAAQMGVLPFIAGDVAKVAVAAVIASRLRRRTATLR